MVAPVPTWIQFFAGFFDELAETNGTRERLADWGLREGWLQGEMCRAGRERGMSSRGYSLPDGGTADLYCQNDPRMVAEIKVIGADHQSKMRVALDKDVERLQGISEAQLEKYMILVIPTSAKTEGVLYKYLHECSYTQEGCCFEKDYPAFKVRVWRIDSGVLSTTNARRPD
jgi:hypothetical protein